MKNLFSGIIVLVFLTGCSNIALHVKPQVIHSGNCNINTSLEELLNQTHGGPLQLDRKVFKDEKNNYLVYEKGLLDADLIFIAPLPEIMKAGFELSSYQSFSLDRHHDLIIGTGRNSTTLYILAQSLNEGFSILYSQNYEPLKPLVECLGGALELQASPSKHPKTANEAIKSDWRVATFARHRIAVSKYFEEL